MATGTIQVQNKVITGAFTPESGVTLNELRVVQIGKVCQLKFYAKKTGGFTSDGTNKVGVLSGISPPPSDVRFAATAALQPYLAPVACYAILGPDGQLSVVPSTTQDSVNINLVYTVD